VGKKFQKFNANNTTIKSVAILHGNYGLTFHLIVNILNFNLPIPVAARSKA
jgi:hypothetical protein